MAEIRNIACQSATPDLPEWLAKEWEEQGSEAKVREEVERLISETDEPPGTALPASYEAIRRRMQAEIIVEEIPDVARAVAADRAADGARGSVGSSWERLFPAGSSLTVEKAVDAFKQCRIGEETLESEIGSDYFTRISTKAGAVVASVLGGSVPKLKVLRPALALIRGLLLTLYLLARGVTESSKTGTFLVALTLSVGGAFVALFAVGTDVPGLLLLLGALILISGVLLAVVRKTERQIALAGAIFLGSAAAYYGLRVWDGRPRWVDALAAMLAVVIMAFSAMVLGWSSKKTPADPGEGP